MTPNKLIIILFITYVCTMNTSVCWRAPGDIAILDYTSLRKLSIGMKSQLPTFRVLVLGAAGVGKTALIVRFVTHRFIGDYDRGTERIYQHQTMLENGQSVSFAVLDPVNNELKADNDLRDQILWADAYVLVYSVTDQCSLDEVDRLRFLVNHVKRSRSRDKSAFASVPDSVVFLTGNKDDIFGERMVSYQAGLERSRELNCYAFFEISVRESVDAPVKIFHDLYGKWEQARQNEFLRPPGSAPVTAQEMFTKSFFRGRLQNSSSPVAMASPTSSGRSSSEGEISPRIKRKMTPRMRAKHFFAGLSQQNSSYSLSVEEYNYTTCDEVPDNISVDFPVVDS